MSGNEEPDVVQPPLPFPPHPFPLSTWLASFQRTQAQPSATEVTTNEDSLQKEEHKMEVMTGGWRYEGKSKPETPKICTKCQYRGEEEIDRKGWCSPCKAGKNLGHEPEGVKPGVTDSTDLDAVNQAKAFFGG